jgi:hypothetical protein
MNKYNDGLNNDTEVQIISTYRRPLTEKTKQIIKDLGTIPNSLQSNLNTSHPNLETTLGSAEMYNNINITDLDCYSYTFQQSNENECGLNARISPQETSSRSISEKKALAQDVFGSLGGNGSATKKLKNEPRRLNPNDHYVAISVAINNIRCGSRYERMTLYASLQEVNDNKYDIFLVSNLTSAHDEVRRSITKYNNHEYLLGIFDTMVNTYNDCVIGRVRYNPKNKKSNIFYKKNLKSALVCVFTNNGNLCCHLHILGTDYIFNLTDKFMSAKQKEVYKLMGYYAEDLGETDE